MKFIKHSPSLGAQVISYLLRWAAIMVVITYLVIMIPVELPVFGFLMGIGTGLIVALVLWALADLLLAVESIAHYAKQNAQLQARILEELNQEKATPDNSQISKP